MVDDRCSKLRRLHSQMVHEINVLKENEREEEREGVENPIETRNILKGLQDTLQLIEAELAKCPE